MRRAIVAIAACLFEAAIFPSPATGQPAPVDMAGIFGRTGVDRAGRSNRDAGSSDLPAGRCAQPPQREHPRRAVAGSDGPFRRRVDGADAAPLPQPGRRRLGDRRAGARLRAQASGALHSPRRRPARRASRGSHRSAGQRQLRAARTQGPARQGRIPGPWRVHPGAPRLSARLRRRARRGSADPRRSRRDAEHRGAGGEAAPSGGLPCRGGGSAGPARPKRCSPRIRTPCSSGRMPAAARAPPTRRDDCAPSRT